MLKNKFFLILLSATLLWGCGEAGVQSDVSKVTEISFDIAAGDFTPVAGFLLADLRQVVDPTEEEFSEYRDDVENYIVNKLEIQITNYTVTGNDPTVVFFGMGAGPIGNLLGPNIISEDSRTSNNTPLIDALTDANDKITNTDKIVIFDRSNESNGLILSTNAGIQQVLSALENNSQFEGRVQVATQGGALTGGFTVTFFFDLTARVQLD